ncbi:MAG: NUDIX domain-containing protein [Bacteroidia bacterium]|jgi:8-oxo-dGTP pyrophosphatase MutT (NUDIX family)|nr:NUDIX domain-containing protein [Bacteroidia bacterium]
MNNKIYFGNHHMHFISSESQVSDNEGINFYELNLKKGTEFNRTCRDFISHNKSIQLLIKDISFEQVLEALKKEFRYIEAAGGFIQKADEYLFIHRHGRWDLPKGKLEKGEGIQEAAIRECEEECGVKNLKIEKPLRSTFHLYPFKRDIALKQAYWFYMTTNFEGPLVPQTGESIEKAEWVKKEKVMKDILPDTYLTIRDVIKEALVLST